MTSCDWRHSFSFLMFVSSEVSQLRHLWGLLWLTIASSHTHQLTIFGFPLPRIFSLCLLILRFKPIVYCLWSARPLSSPWLAVLLPHLQIHFSWRESVLVLFMVTWYLNYTQEEESFHLSVRNLQVHSCYFSEVYTQLSFPYWRNVAWG